MANLGLDNLPEFLIAWTQGDLDPAAVAAVQRMLREQPDAMACIDANARLAAEARRALLSTAPAVPPALHARIAAMRSESGNRTPAPWIGTRIAAWVAVAASITIAAGIGWRIGERTHPPVSPLEAQTSVIPASMVSTAGRIHAMCARVAERLHAAGYPTELTNLPRDVETDVRTGHPYPDLSSIGYHYVGAGPCGAYLPGTVHLLYKADQNKNTKDTKEPQTIQAISIFVQENRRHFPINADKLYIASNGSDPFPMFVWRTDKVVYFLIADTAETARDAIKAIACSPR